MPQGRHTRAQARKRALQRRRRIIIALGIAAAALVIMALILIRRPRTDAPAAPTPTEAIATASATAASTPSPSPSPTPTDTPAPTEAPTPAATPLTGDFPSQIGFYQPEGKAYSPRVRMDGEYAARWKKGEDIGSFEVIASDAPRLEGDFFGDIFGAAWKRYAGADQCRIGYTLRYTLEDGGEVRYTMLSPAHIEHTEYIECWLYDDYHRQPHKRYSHIKSMKKDTLMTSIKLTCGKRVDQVREIWLTAFICSSLQDFDAERNYTGPTSCTLHIVRK